MEASPHGTPGPDGPVRAGRRSFWLGWPAALAIVLAALAVELLPVVFGTGERTTWDWSFLYVTMRFVLLPLVCLAHVGSNVGWVVMAGLERSPVRWSARTSIVVPATYLIALYLDPLPLLRFLYEP